VPGLVKKTVYVELAILHHLGNPQIKET